MKSLVSAQWLAQHLDEPDLVVLDASAHLPMAGRDPAKEFAQRHIKGARFLDLSALVDKASPVPAALPTREQFASHLGALGVRPEDRVVLYDDSHVKTAARAWFIFRHCGMRSVAVLDGGLGNWLAEGLPIESGTPAARVTAFVAEGTGMPVRTKAEILANLASKAELLVDARDARRFSGEEGDFRPEVARGHIPGSRNLPFDALFNPDGTYKDEAGIRASFAGAGVDLSGPIVTTCGGGVTAAVLLFALHLIGKDDVALYDGSWGEWGTDPATPKALGTPA